MDGCKNKENHVLLKILVIALIALSCGDPCQSQPQDANVEQQCQTEPTSSPSPTPSEEVKNDSAIKTSSVTVLKQASQAPDQTGANSKPGSVIKQNGVRASDEQHLESVRKDELEPAGASPAPIPAPSPTISVTPSPTPGPGLTALEVTQEANHQLQIIASTPEDSSSIDSMLYYQYFNETDPDCASETSPSGALIKSYTSVRDGNYHYFNSVQPGCEYAYRVVLIYKNGTARSKVSGGVIGP
jgi:hypothetical protein